MKEHADKALGQDPDGARPHKERLDLHLDEAVDASGVYLLESPESIADSLVAAMGLKGVARVRAKGVAVRAIEARDKQLRERMLWEARSAARLKFHRSVSMLFEAVACDLGAPHGGVAIDPGGDPKNPYDDTAPTILEIVARVHAEVWPNRLCEKCVKPIGQHPIGREGARCCPATEDSGAA